MTKCNLNGIGGERVNTQEKEERNVTVIAQNERSAKQIGTASQQNDLDR